jgi:glutamate-1-semialdehyde 2,1-aminomutase
VKLAQLIVRAVHSVEQVRFTVSGTEACLTAIRLARGVTGRTKLLTCEGAYHGHSESLMAHRSAGGLKALDRHTLVVPFNDAGAFEQALRRYGEQLACVIVEPVAANMGVVAPLPGYLHRIRELTRRYGILLIFDEVVTGFRVGLGGAQGLFGIQPDLTTFGKIIGGGLPIGALGGPKRLMQHLAPEGKVFHGGTFAGHPLAMAAGISTLQQLMAHPPYERLEALGRRLSIGLTRAAEEAGIAVQLNRVGSMWSVFFSAHSIHNFAQAKATDQRRFACWAESLRHQDIVVPPSPYEAMFLSSAHSVGDVRRCVSASLEAFQRCAKDGTPTPLQG